MDEKLYDAFFISGVRLSRPLPRESYLSRLASVQALEGEGIIFNSPVTFFIGENGTGKSTLIEALAVAAGFNPEGGTINFDFSTADSHSELYRYIKLRRGLTRARDGFFLRAESFYNVASEIDRLDAFGPPLIDSYGGVSLHRQSHGESFLALVENRFGGHGLYILDEPEAALSPERQMRLLVHIRRLVECGSQFIIATHSPMLIAFPGAAVYELTEEGVRLTLYRETTHFRLMRQFLGAPEKILSVLFGEEG